MDKNQDMTREAITLQYVGKPPITQFDGKADSNAMELRELAAKTTSATPTKGPISLSINYIRVDGNISSASVVGGVAQSLAGVLYEDIGQIKEIIYTERIGKKERCLISVTQPEWQIPSLFEPNGEIGIIKDNPINLFPDDTASKWMMGLLLACEDIGVVMKLTSPYLFSPKAPTDPHIQYRTSHMMYFWRLWLGHIHEAWVAFNKKGDDLICRLKTDAEVKRSIQRIATLRGKKVDGGVSAGEFIEKCRHTVFHYVESDGDQWGEKLKILPKDFNICVSCDQNRDVDTRWLIADEYLLSRLSGFGLGNKELNQTASDLAVETIKLIRSCQKIYFDIRKAETQSAGIGDAFY